MLLVRSVLIWPLETAMLTRILVPTDFSGPSNAALDYARVLARTFGASLHVLHVLQSHFLRASVTSPREAETGALQQVDRCLTDDDRQSLRAVALVERSDEPADEIVSHARTAEIDLIVMGTHGRNGIAHLLMGSVAERVVRTAPCPVMTVRDARIARATAPVGRTAPVAADR
ncbi:MAG: universal stress protein [Acidobacteria bacterium]|nr:universal stress protein [Acidobacteriota bacterium]